MMMTMRASTLAKVEMTWRMAPHFTFIQLMNVRRPGDEGQCSLSSRFHTHKEEESDQE